jgi:predicted phosphodiesterase
MTAQCPKEKMSAPLAFLSDIHGNSSALRAVLSDIRRFDPSLVFVLGDVVNGPDPAGCMRILRELPRLHVLKGNAEHYLLTPDLADFPERKQPFYRNLIALIEWWRSRLPEADLEWIETWPDYLVWSGRLLVHDSPQGRMDPRSRYRPDTDGKYQEIYYHPPGLTADMGQKEVSELLAFLDAQQFSAVLAGHTHVPFIRRIGDRVIGNIGSAGMPLDGDPRPSWVLVDEDGEMVLRRIAYDLQDILAMVDQTPEYPAFMSSAHQKAFKRMYQTGRYWGSFLSAEN